MSDNLLDDYLRRLDKNSELVNIPNRGERRFVYLDTVKQIVKELYLNISTPIKSECNVYIDKQKQTQNRFKLKERIFRIDIDDECYVKKSEWDECGDVSRFAGWIIQFSKQKKDIRKFKVVYERMAEFWKVKRIM